MKKLIFALLILSACSDQEEAGGCLTAIPNNGTERVFVRCLTKSQYLNGEHDTPSWNSYKGHKFETCGNCN